jgi:hypothetical protein
MENKETNKQIGYSKSETKLVGVEFTLKDGSKQFIPKIETLEEAAKKYSNIPVNTVIDTEERYFNSNVRDYDSFIEGAKWQEKRMYSEEEVLKLLNLFAEYANDEIGRTIVVADKWFEQYKKK